MFVCPTKNVSVAYVELCVTAMMHATTVIFVKTESVSKDVVTILLVMPIKLVSGDNVKVPIMFFNHIGTIVVICTYV